MTWDEVGGRVGINRGRNAPYFTLHFDGFPALIPWFSTGSMVSLIPSFITYQKPLLLLVVTRFRPKCCNNHRHNSACQKLRQCVGTPNPMRKFKDKPSFQLARSFQEKIIKHKLE
jgi:hypothetical protein